MLAVRSPLRAYLHHEVGLHSKVRLLPTPALQLVITPCFRVYRALDHEPYPTLLALPTLQPNSPSRLGNP
jgi:hypothetical protein